MQVIQYLLNSWYIFRNTEKQRKQSVNLMLRLVLFITLVLAAVTLSYMVY